MPVEFTIEDGLVEKSSGVIRCNFRNEDGQAVDPKTAAWTLTDILGAVINSRDAIVISSPTSEEDVLLSNDDLQLSAGFSGNAEWRVFIIEATYDSNLGNDLPLKDFCTFPVINIAHITNP